MSIIFITEKPSVAQEYKKVLKVQPNGKTDGYIEGYSPIMKDNVIVTWAVGHLVTICPPEKQNEAWAGKWSIDNLPMIPQKFRYEPIKDTYNQFKIVKSLYLRKDIDTIYYAGDSAREGIYIQALIRSQIFQTPPKINEYVVWIDSYTENEILRGIREAKPYSHYQKMIDSGYARAMTDWLIGMNFTEAFTLTSGKLINTGRVMTPTLAMVVNRQKEIDNFVKTDFYGIKANDSIYWKAVEGSRYYESPLLYNENGFRKKEDALKLCMELNRDKKLTVNDVKVQTKTEYAPYLFNLADIQAYCSKIFKITPAKTLEIAQSLYEKKLTTYPRTDSRFLSTAVAAELKRMGYNIPKRYIDDSKVTDHYAIIPTFDGNPESLSGLEKSVYEAIKKRFEDTMKPPFIYDAISVTYIHKNGEYFFETFRKIKQMGYKEKAEEDNIKNKPIPRKGEVIPVASFDIRNLETKPPVPYTTGTLILAMEKAGNLIEDEELREKIKTCGIGTSSTRAAIIEKLEKKEFITIDSKQRIAPTEFGKAVIPIIERFDETLISPIKTAEMEENLNEIVTGKLTLAENMKTVINYIISTTKKILQNNNERIEKANYESKITSKKYNCPCCNQTLKVGRYGWYCDCKFSFNLEICGHRMQESDLEDLITKGKTKTYSFTSKAGKKFKAKIVLDKEAGKTTFEFDKNNNYSQQKIQQAEPLQRPQWGARMTAATWGRR